MTQDDPALVEAPSNRSKCQSCRELIALGSHRVGLPYYHGGFTVTKWHHPSCFKRHCLLVDYAPTDRAKDTSDGTPISKGQPRLVIGEGGSYRKYATEGSNPGLADPRQVCYSHAWASPWTGPTSRRMPRPS